MADMDQMFLQQEQVMPQVGKSVEEVMPQVGKFVEEVMPQVGKITELTKQLAHANKRWVTEEYQNNTILDKFAASFRYKRAADYIWTKIKDLQAASGFVITHSELRGQRSLCQDMHPELACVYKEYAYGPGCPEVAMAVEMVASNIQGFMVPRMFLSDVDQMFLQQEEVMPQVGKIVQEKVRLG